MDHERIDTSKRNEGKKASFKPILPTVNGHYQNDIFLELPWQRWMSIFLTILSATNFDTRIAVHIYDWIIRFVFYFEERMMRFASSVSPMLHSPLFPFSTPTIVRYDDIVKLFTLMHVSEVLSPSQHNERSKYDLLTDYKTRPKHEKGVSRAILFLNLVYHRMGADGKVSTKIKFSYQMMENWGNIDDYLGKCVCVCVIFGFDINERIL